MSHENKLYILNNEHYWHRCVSASTFSDNRAVFTNRYKKYKSYFRCATIQTCTFKFPSILSLDVRPTRIYGTRFQNKKIYEFGPEYTVFWEHLSQHKKGYVEIDVSEFQNL